VKKRFLGALLVVVVALFAAACPPPQPVEVEERYIFMFKTTAIGDWSWGASSYNALVYVAEKLGFRYAFREIVSHADLESVLVAAAKTPEYKIIFGSGIAETYSILRHAHRFPDKVFISTCIPSANLPYAPPNWATIYFVPYNIGYVWGYVAALMTETGIIAVATGTELMCANMFTNGFRLGAYAANPDVRVIYAEVGVWGDPAKEMLLAHALADKGVDIIFSLWLGVGITEAVAERGIYEIGTYNKRELNPHVVLGDAIEDHTVGLELIVRDFLEGRDFGRAYTVPARVEFNEALVPEDVIKRAQEIMAKIDAGAIVVPVIINRTPDTWPHEPVPIGKLVFGDPKGAAFIPEELREELKRRFLP
jgi:basic membrane lipoprotein Med (substrate-binding protein (PBP1-ABC) superfamily)